MRERTSIISNQYLLLMKAYSIILLDTQEKRRFLQQSVSTLFIKKDLDAFMPIQFQLLLLPCLVQMLSLMLSTLFSWPSKIWSSTIKTLTLHLVSVMLDAAIKGWTWSSEMVLAEPLEHPLSKTRWLDKNRQFQLSGKHLMDKHGPNLLSEVSSENQTMMWRRH